MKNFISKILSFKKDENHLFFCIAGIKIVLRNTAFSNSEKEIQNTYDLADIKNAKKLIVFLIPDKKIINGGIMSIFSICSCTRKICPDAVCVISTVPGKYTYSHNPYFKNKEKIYRWEQIINNTNNSESMILHVPEYFAAKLYKSLQNKELITLKNIKNLQINIMNQNIDFMPEPHQLKSLYKITDNITQTIAHDRYATEETGKKWGLPTHLLSVRFPDESYKTYAFKDKKKIIVLSPDKNPYKKKIVSKLKKEHPDFAIVTVENLKYSEYLDLISSSYFTITFGEGFDAYFNQPIDLGSVSFSVYNNEFFPDKSWQDMENVYSSYEEMLEKISADMKKLLASPQEYYRIISECKNKKIKLYSTDRFMKNLENFYSKKYFINT